MTLLSSTFQPPLQRKYTQLLGERASFNGAIQSQISNIDKLSALPADLFGHATSWLSRADYNQLPQLNFGYYLQTAEDRAQVDSLDLSNSNIDDAGLAHILRQYPRLTTLNLQECRKITGAGLQMLARAIAERPILDLNLLFCGDDYVTSEDWLQLINNLGPQLQNFDFSFPVDQQEQLIRAAPLSKMGVILIRNGNSFSFSDDLMDYLSNQLFDSHNLKIFHLHGYHIPIDKTLRLLHALNSPVLREISLSGSCEMRSLEDKSQLTNLLVEKLPFMPSLRAVCLFANNKLSMDQKCEEVQQMMQDPKLGPALKRHLADQSPELRALTFLLLDKNASLGTLFQFIKDKLNASAYKDQFTPEEMLECLLKIIVPLNTPSSDPSAFLALMTLLEAKETLRDNTGRLILDPQGNLVLRNHLPAEAHEAEHEANHREEELPIYLQNDNVLEGPMVNLQSNQEEDTPIHLQNDPDEVNPRIDQEVPLSMYLPNDVNQAESKVEPQETLKDKSRLSLGSSPAQPAELNPQANNANQIKLTTILLLVSIIILANRYLFSENKTLSVD